MPSSATAGGGEGTRNSASVRAIGTKRVAKGRLMVTSRTGAITAGSADRSGGPGIGSRRHFQPGRRHRRPDTHRGQCFILGARLRSPGGRGRVFAIRAHPVHALHSPPACASTRPPCRPDAPVPMRASGNNGDPPMKASPVSLVVRSFLVAALVLGAVAADAPRKGAKPPAEGKSGGAGKDKEKDNTPPVWKSETYSGLKFRSIGPALTSGRIGDVAVAQNDPNTWYVGVCSGG